MNARRIGGGLASVLALAVLPFAPPTAAAQEPPAVDLHLAALQGNAEAVRQHAVAGSDLDARDAYGSTPLIIAATFDRPEVVRALVEGGADPDIRNPDGATALFIASFLCREQVVDILLAHGADRSLRDDDGRAPFDAVNGPFEDVRGIYDALGQALAPLGVRLDYERIERTRPTIAEKLRPSRQALAAVEYAPVAAADLPVSTPEAEGLDPDLVAELYLDAASVTTLDALLVLRNDRLVAEGYFHDGALDRAAVVQSVTKSYTSALVGIALERGCLSDLDQRMIEFFPELAPRIEDPRKEEITVRQLLQMRAGYPWEEREPPYMDRLFMQDDWRWLPHIVDFPLTRDPGAGFGYSNLTSHILGVIVARACDTQLETLARRALLGPIDARLGSWSRDEDGYNYGSFELAVRPRDMAKFGLLYLHRGEYDGRRVLPAAWVDASLERYSSGMWDERWRPDADAYLGPYFRDVGYGYQWWSATANGRRIDWAWGHGGNLIVLLHDLDMILVTQADPLFDVAPEDSWTYEGAVLNLVGKFLSLLPDP